MPLSQLPSSHFSALDDKKLIARLIKHAKNLEAAPFRNMSDTAKKFSDELKSAAKNWITNELEKMLQEERGHEESMRHGRGRSCKQ